MTDPYHASGLPVAPDRPAEGADDTDAHWHEPPDRGGGGWLGAVLILVVLGFAVSFLAGAAFGHQAPSGWTYDAACCSDRDCTALRFGRVTLGPEGWIVRIEEGEHHYFPGATTVVVPYGDRRLRRSGDTEFHGCLDRTGRLLCLYVPPMGG